MNPNATLGPGVQVAGSILQDVRPAAADDAPIFNFLDRLARRANGKQLVAKFVHSPLAEMLVAATPAPVDDAVRGAWSMARTSPPLNWRNSCGEYSRVVSTVHRTARKMAAAPK